jgi:hypothetical protein
MNMKKRIKITLYFSVLFGHINIALAGDPLKDAVMELDIKPEAVIQEVELLELGGNECLTWVESKGWQLGENYKKSGDMFFIQVGSGRIQAPPGHPNYVNSRQNAYTKAMLDAKGNIISSLSMTIEREIQLKVKEGQFGSERNKPPAGKVGSIWDKTLSLLNSELDSRLKEQGVIDATDAEKQRKAQDIAQKTLNSESFKDMINTAAAMRLKGVRRVFVNESVQKGKQGEICVAALYSSKTMELADAIVTGDLSNAPKGKAGKPIKSQIPSWKTPSGVRQLMNAYGTEMLRDEDGTYHLIAYAQAGTRTDSKTSRNIALNKSNARAMAELATFAKENAKLTDALESAESFSELSDKTVNYESHEAYQRDLSSITSPINFSGAKRIGQWAAKHPVTEQIIVGTIVEWSTKSASAAQQTQHALNSTSGSGNQNTRERIDESSYGQSKSFSGSAQGGSSEEDF